MLFLTRRKDERIIIEGGLIVIAVLEVSDGQVRLGFEAPPGLRIDREEVHLEQLQRELWEGRGRTLAPLRRRLENRVIDGNK